MSCYVYFLYSKQRRQFYVGVSNDVTDRLKRHNNGESLSTKSCRPWMLLHTISCADKSVAMQLEMKIKKRGISRYLGDNGTDTGLYRPALRREGRQALSVTIPTQEPYPFDFFRRVFLFWGLQVFPENLNDVANRLKRYNNAERLSTKSVTPLDFACSKVVRFGVVIIRLSTLLNCGGFCKTHCPPNGNPPGKQIKKAR